MKVFAKSIDYLAQEKKLISSNKNQVDSSNGRMLSVIIFWWCVACILLLVTSFIMPTYAMMKLNYLVMLIVSLSFIFAIKYFKNTSTILLYYLFYSLFAGFATYSSAFVNPDYLGIIILVFLFEVPVMLIDRTSRLYLYEIIITAMYLIIVIPRKNNDIVTDEIVNTISFMIVGCVTGQFFRTTRLKNMNLARHLEEERTLDFLTGLYNRRVLFEYFEKYEAKEINNDVCAIAIIDIDNFKQFNDTYGHIAGDRCLLQIGCCLREFAKSHSIECYRYGGEEFIAIVHKEPQEDITSLFLGLNKMIEDLHITHSYLPGGYVTVSIGAIKVDVVNTVTQFERMIEKADKALYQVKNSGKGRTLEYKNPSI